MSGPTVDGNIKTVGYTYEGRIVFIFMSKGVQQYVSYVQAIPIKIRGLGTRTRCKITRGEQKQMGFFAALMKLQPRVVTSARDGQGLREPAEVAEACGAVYV